MPPLARLPRILDAVADEVRSRGLVGEEQLARTLYLVLTSRLLDKQVSVGIKGHSASGKSYTVETVTRFFPPEAYLEFTAMTERALVYSTEEFAHRTLIVYEVTALREGVEDDMTSYFVRSLLSRGASTTRSRSATKTVVSPPRRSSRKARPTWCSPPPRPGSTPRTRPASCRWPPTTHGADRAGVARARRRSDGGDDLAQWRDLQRWLADAEHRVTIPYARKLGAAGAACRGAAAP